MRDYSTCACLYILEYKIRFVLADVWSGYSDLLQGEASIKHLSFYSLASHQMLSLELSVGTTGLWLGSLLVSFNAAVQYLGSSDLHPCCFTNSSWPGQSRSFHLIGWWFIRACSANACQIGALEKSDSS